MSSAQPNAGQLVVISGPSGSGKTSIIERLREHPRVRVSVSVTTRKPRAGEVDGRHYTFVDRDTFLQMNAAGRFVETNDVFGNGSLYGSDKRELDEALAEPGCVYIMEVDTLGARHIREAGYAGTYIFIAPPDDATLEQRLRSRGTDDDLEIRRRLGRANEEREMARADNALIVINDEIDAAARRILDEVGLSPTAT